MKTKCLTGRGARAALLAPLASLGLLLSAPATQAFNGILTDFNNTYPGSSSGDNARCQLCHGSSTSTWNEYGWGLRQNGNNFAASENDPSVNLDGGTTMLDEINASTQPGWTSGANNNLYDDGGLITGTQTPPANIGALDPAGNLPPVADPNGPYTGAVGVNVIFDGTGSTDPDGTLVAYDWDFGDGTTGTGPQPQHAYLAAGSYPVTLTVTDDSGATSAAATTATIDADNQAPTADPNGPYSGTVGVPVDFDGSASTDPDGTLVAYAWDFGDGNTGTGVNPSHSYAGSGVFTVSLTVTDDAGAADTATTTATIGEGNQPPTADPNGPYTGEVGMPITFDGTGSSDPEGSLVAYDWDFGDGNVGTGPTPTHTYTVEGTYNVTLTVTDEAGAMDAAGTTATIGVTDVFLASLRVPNKVNGKVGQAVQKRASARGDGTTSAQNATVTLSAVASPGIGVVIQPEAITQEVVPGNPLTNFGSFNLLISCDTAGSGTLEWTATISASANADPNNDVLSGTTAVTCR